MDSAPALRTIHAFHRDGITICTTSDELMNPVDGWCLCACLIFMADITLLGLCFYQNIKECNKTYAYIIYRFYCFP